MIVKFITPAGVPHEILMSDFWVPQSTSRQEVDRFRNKDLYKSILTTTDRSCLTYFERATKDLVYHHVHSIMFQSI